MYFYYNGYWVTISEDAGYYDVCINQEFVESHRDRTQAIKTAVKFIEYLSGGVTHGLLS